MTASPSTVDFRLHAVRGGSDEFGRVDFHRMLTALIQVTHPTASEVRADPGDWGIDTFVGSLVDSISVWQSKYFYLAVGSSQQQQIRESFAAAIANAHIQGFRLERWTLCVATTLSAPERKWWDGKVRKWKRDYPTVLVDLWDAPRLRGLLLSPDAEHVFAEFYGPSRDWSNHPGDLDAVGPVISVPSPEVRETPGYEDALFMRQLHVAGVTETNMQRYAFFNAELLARDIAARGVPEHARALRELDAEVWSVWEHAWLNPTTTPTQIAYQVSARRLLSSVLTGVGAIAAPPHLPVQLRHLRGLMHRIVEDGRAGWVCDWRVVAEAHRVTGHAAPVPVHEVAP